jgi:hypothetical protein
VRFGFLNSFVGTCAIELISGSGGASGEDGEAPRVPSSGVPTSHYLPGSPRSVARAANLPTEQARFTGAALR